MKKIQSNRYDLLYGMNEKYASGFYKAFSDINALIFNDMVSEGYKPIFSLKGTLSTKVIEKSNRFAKVELSGAKYEIVIKKENDLIYKKEITQDTSGIASLKRCQMVLGKSMQRHKLNLDQNYLIKKVLREMQGKPYLGSSFFSFDKARIIPTNSYL